MLHLTCFWMTFVMLIPLCVHGRMILILNCILWLKKLNINLISIGDVDKMNYLLYYASMLNTRKKLKYVRFCFLEMYVDLLVGVCLKMLNLKLV